jgi:hypothetical protein
VKLIGCTEKENCECLAHTLCSIIIKCCFLIESDAFGLSNYSAWQVAEIVGICHRYNYVLPTVYQGELAELCNLSDSKFSVEYLQRCITLLAVR